MKAPGNRLLLNNSYRHVLLRKDLLETFDGIWNVLPYMNYIGMYGGSKEYGFKGYSFLPFRPGVGDVYFSLA